MFNLTRNSRKVALALALGAGLAGLAALPAAAQPGPRGDHFIQAIAAFKAQLNLDPSQQGLWDAAAASGNAAREAAKQNRLAVKQAVTEEMAKPGPDLARIAAVADQVHETNAAAHRQVRAQWLQLYASFTPEQKAVVKAGMVRRLARMEHFREHMRQRFANP